MDEIPEKVRQLMKELKWADARNECESLGCDPAFIDKQVERIKAGADKRLQRREYATLVDEYIATIGLIDSSIVLCKFIDPHLSVYLIKYLLELHKRGRANEIHTKLLFNLFRQSEAQTQLNDFMRMISEYAERRDKTTSVGIFGKKTDDAEAACFLDNFCGDAAITTLKENGMNEMAFQLARTLKSLVWETSLLISYKQDYEQAVELLERQADIKVLIEFGPQLLTCRKSSVRDRVVDIAEKVWLSNTPGRPDHYMKLFSSASKCCYTFLTRVMSVKSCQLFENRLISLVIPRKGAVNNDIASIQQAITYITERRGLYDDNYVLHVCSEANFIDGMVILLTKMGKIYEVINLLISQNESALLMRWCKENEHAISGDEWCDIFKFFVGKEGWSKLPQGPERMEFVNKLIAKASQSMPFVAVIEMMSHNPDIPIADVRTQLLEYVQSLEMRRADANAKREATLSTLQSLEDEIEHLEDANIEFKKESCDACHMKLEYPIIGFMCGHVYHIMCAQRGCDGMQLYCPIDGSPADEIDVHDQSRDFISEIDFTSPDLLEEAAHAVEHGMLRKQAL